MSKDWKVHLKVKFLMLKKSSNREQTKADTDRRDQMANNTNQLSLIVVRIPA